MKELRKFKFEGTKSITIVADSREKAIYFYYLTNEMFTTVSFQEFKEMKLDHDFTMWESIMDENHFIGWASGETDNESLINQINANYQYYTQLKNDLIDRLKK